MGGGDARRVLVLGCSGGGKSAVAARIGATRGLPVLHLDRIWWQPGWRQREPEDFLSDLDAHVAQPGWVIDGNHPLGLERRVRAADTAVVVDVPAVVCLWRLVRRRVSYRGRSRPSMADGCRERLRPRFMWYVLRYRRRTLPGILDTLRRAGPQVEVVFVGRRGLQRETPAGGRPRVGRSRT